MYACKRECICACRYIEGILTQNTSNRINVETHGAAVCFVFLFLFTYVVLMFSEEHHTFTYQIENIRR